MMRWRIEERREGKWAAGFDTRTKKSYGRDM